MLSHFESTRSPINATDLRESGEEIHRVNLRTSSNASLQLHLARTRHLLPQQRRHEDDELRLPTASPAQSAFSAQRTEEDAWRRTARPVSAQSWYADAYPENVTYSRTEQVRGG